ncbi:hypothetical protein LOC71_05365 [Rhodopirellula sp. JC740]|uniref:Uncharacterized protein n=1 Tax=Rhodopirellula halodulae TaxID=2894198 RepID=A0ABS8NE47_9BACT|nr:hypothetical protein [Rhodopirellula sp. JC740]MCC9641694.1 hypothetical protein [Rhodopirellula sp. JC740]
MRPDVPSPRRDLAHRSDSVPTNHSPAMQSPASGACRAAERVELATLTDLATRRWNRLHQLLPEVADRWTPETVGEFWRGMGFGTEPVLAPVSSRLGNRPVRHRAMARQLAASMMDARQRRQSVATVVKSAADPWVTHAASTFDVPLVRMNPDDMSLERLLPPNDRMRLCMERDEWIVALADRMDVLHLRRGGKIERAVLKRLEVDPFGVRVAMEDAKAAKRLLAAGALGRFLPRSTEDLEREREQTAKRESGLEANSSNWNDEEWLVHCTRRCDGPWPGQSWSQYRDEMLLGSDEAASREPLDTLRRIVRMRRLISGATTSKQTHRVVCFSAVPLPELLRRRTFRSHVSRWDYEPYGIAIRRRAAIDCGLKPVVYGRAFERNAMAEEDRFLFQSAGRDGEWQSEKEWRGLEDLDLASVDPADVRVFVPSEREAAKIAAVNGCDWQVIFVSGMLRQ